MKRARLASLKYDAGAYLCEALSELEAAHANLDLAGVPHKEESLHVRIDVLAKERYDARSAAISELQRVVDELKKTDKREVRKMQDAMLKVYGSGLGEITVKKGAG